MWYIYGSELLFSLKKDRNSHACCNMDDSNIMLNEMFHSIKVQISIIWFHLHVVPRIAISQRTLNGGERMWSYLNRYRISVSVNKEISGGGWC